MPYELKTSASADRALQRLPESIAAAVVELITGTLLENPRRVGKPLKGERAGYRAARRGAYRVIYRIEDGEGIVRVVAIEHRADVYRPR